MHHPNAVVAPATNDRVRRFVARARGRKAVSIALARSEAFVVSLLLSTAALCAALRLALPGGETAAAALAPGAAAAVLASVALRLLLSLRGEARPFTVALDVDRGLYLGDGFSTAFELESEGRTGLFEDALVLKTSSSLDDGALKSLFPIRWFWPAWGAALLLLMLAAFAPLPGAGSHPPVVSRVSPSSAQVDAFRGAQVSFFAAASDEGEDMCSFEVEVDGLVEWSAVEPMRGSARRSRTLRFDREGARRVAFRFGDAAGNTGEAVWTVVVKGDPRPPLVERLRPVSEKTRVKAGEKTDFEARATDPDADLSRWEVKVDRASMDGERGKLGSTAQRTWSKSWENAGKKKVSMSFSDSTGRVASVTWEVEVYEPGEDAAGGSGMGEDEKELPQNSPDAAGGGGGGESGRSPMLGEPERTPAQFEDVRVQPLFGPSGKTETAQVKVPMPKVGGPGRSPEDGGETEFIQEDLFAKWEKMAERALGSGRIGKEDRKTVTGYFDSVRRLLEESKKQGDQGK